MFSWLSRKYRRTAEFFEKCELVRKVELLERQINSVELDAEDLRLEVKILKSHNAMFVRERDSVLDLLDRVAWQARADGAAAKTFIASVADPSRGREPG